MLSVTNMQKITHQEGASTFSQHFTGTDLRFEPARHKVIILHQSFFFRGDISRRAVQILLQKHKATGKVKDRKLSSWPGRKTSQNNFALKLEDVQ